MPSSWHRSRKAVRGELLLKAPAAELMALKCLKNLDFPLTYCISFFSTVLRHFVAFPHTVTDVCADAPDELDTVALA